MSSLSLATAYVDIKVRGDLTRDLARQLAAADRLNKILDTPRGQQALRTRLEIQKKISQQEERIRVQEDVAKGGKAYAWLGIAERNLQSFAGAFSNLEEVARQFWGVMQSSSSVADFTTFSTFQASMKAMAIEVGALFTPAMQELTEKVQGAVVWFRGLDESTRAQIGRFAMWGGIIAVSVIVLGKLAGALLTAVQAMRALTLSMMTSPIGWIIGATVAVLGLVAAWKMAGSSAKNANDEMTRAHVPGAGQRAAQIEQLPPEVQARYRAAATDAEKQRIMQEEDARRQEELLRLRKAEAEGRMEVVGPGAGMNQWMGQRNPFGPGMWQRDRIAELEQQLGAIRGFGQATGRETNMPLGQNLDMPFRSRFTSAENYQESLQLAALEQGSTDMQNLTRQLENTVNALGEGMLVTRIADLTEAVRNLAPGFAGGVPGLGP